MGINKENAPLKNYIKYSGFAFQLAASIVIALFIGKWLDEKLNVSKPYFSAFLAFFAVVGMLYHLIKSILNEK